MQTDGLSYQEINAATVDRWVHEGWQWGTPIDHMTYEQATHGNWQVLLTPTRPVPRAWFGDLRGAHVLGLASGGGQQMPIFTAAGASCVVLDYSKAQLESERRVAEREGYDIEIVYADMTRPLPFADASFDLVFNPVSICYIREVEPLWREVARILVPGGTFLAGFELPINQCVSESEKEIVHAYPFDPISDPSLVAELEAGDYGMQFSHGLEETLGGMLRAGLKICDLFEDTNGEGYLHELGLPTMLAVRATRLPGCV